MSDRVGSFPGMRYEYDEFTPTKAEQVAVRSLAVDIDDLIHLASIAFHALPDEQQSVYLAEQRNSWLLGESAMDRIERAQKLVDRIPVGRNMQEAVEYNLTKLQGQLERLSLLVDDYGVNTQMDQTLHNAKKYASELRTALDKPRGS